MRSQRLGVILLLLTIGVLVSALVNYENIKQSLSYQCWVARTPAGITVKQSYAAVRYCNRKYNLRR